MNEHSTALLSQAKEIRRITNDLIHLCGRSATAIDNENPITMRVIREELGHIEVVTSALRARFGEEKRE